MAGASAYPHDRARGGLVAVGVIASAIALVALLGTPRNGVTADSPAAGAASTLRQCEGIRPTITGTRGPDRGAARIVGTRGRDVIAAGPGGDVIFGRGGNDLICGGPGLDRIIGGPGHDRIRGERGNDRIGGGPGRDRINGGAARDLIVGGPGADLIRGWTGLDRIFGRLGPDRIFGGDGPDVLAGGVGADRIKGNRGNDRLVGGPGPDRIRGNQGDDLLIGGPQRDDCDGNGGNNVLRSCEGAGAPPSGPGPPIARDDSFTDAGGDANAIGNTVFKVGTPASAAPEKRIAGSLLDNDESASPRSTAPGRAPGDPEVVAVQGGALTDRPTDLGGEVDVNPDGTFTYFPPAGTTGADDSFSYAIATAGGQATARVTIELDEIAWYVDNSLAANGDGTSFAPFNSLSGLNDPTGAADDDGPGQTIFLYQGTSDTSAGGAYAEGITLEDSQRLLGEPQGLTLDGIELVPPAPGRADIAGRGIVLADGSFVAGVATVGTDEGPAIDGTATDGSFTLVEPLVRSTAGTGPDGDGIRLSGLTTPPVINGPVTIDGATRGLLIDDSSAPVVIGSVSITGGSDTGLVIGGLSPNTAAVEIGGGDLSGNGRGFLVAGGAAPVTYSGTVGAGAANSDAGIVRDRTGGAVKLNGTISGSGDNGGLVIEDNSGGLVDFNGRIALNLTRDAIFATDNGGTTIRFDGGLDVDVTGPARGLVATSTSGGSAGTIVVTDTGPAGETITSTEGIALDVSSAALDASFDQIFTSAATTGAINLQDNAGTTDLGAVIAISLAGPQPTLRAVSAGDVSTNLVSTLAAAGAPALWTESTAGTLRFDSIHSAGSSSDGIHVSGLDGQLAVGPGKAIAAAPAEDAIELLDSPNGSFDLDAAEITASSGSGLLASGGGELAIRDGFVATTTGTPVSIDGTEIGAAGVTFESVSGGLIDDGPAAGITLNDTGAGDFSVTGGSGDDGGTIESATGDAVSLTDVGGAVSLEDMALIRPDGDGIKALRAAGIHLTGITVEEFGLEGLDVDRPAAGATHVSVAGSDFERGDLGTSAEGIDLAAAGAAALTFEVTGSRFDSTLGAIRVEQDGDGTARGTFGGPGAGDRNFVSGQLTGADAVRLDGDGDGGTGAGALVARIENNLIAGAAAGHSDADGVVVTSAGPFPNDNPVDVTITGNEIGANTAALDGQPVRASTTQAGLGSGDGVNLLITDNLLESAFDATDPTVELLGAHDAHMHATLFGNEITAETPGPGPALGLRAATGTGFFTNYCLDLNGTGGGANTIDNGALLDMDMGTFAIGFPPPDAAQPDPVVEAVLAALNSGAAIDADSTGTTGSFFSRAAGCDQPQQP